MTVGVAAGLAERADGDEHSGTWKVAGVDGHPDPCRRAGRVSHRGEAGVQSAPRGAHGAHELEGRRSGENARKIKALAQ